MKLLRLKLLGIIVTGITERRFILISRLATKNITSNGITKPGNIRNLSQQTIQTTSVSQCYKMLGVKSECSDEELRVAYLEKVKHYHPDQASPAADSSKFILVQNAYKIATNYRREKAEIEEEENKTVFEFQHTAPQHRRYLTNEGIGFGTQYNRQKQYHQVRVARANDAVFEHRVNKFGADETAMVTKDKAAARRAKMSKMIDRVVDDLIRESMQKGEFDNLKGAGRPLDYSAHNPMVDTTTHNLNKIMVNNGFKPEWIMLGKEIREEIQAARGKLAVERHKLGPPPYSFKDKELWNKQTVQLKVSVKAVNQRIQKFNMIVPFMDKQMIPYDFTMTVNKIVDNHKKFLPSGGALGSTDDKNKMKQSANIFALPPVSASYINAANIGDHYKYEKINWADVWSDVKGIFKTLKFR